VIASYRAQDLGYTDIEAVIEGIKSNIKELHRFCKENIIEQNVEIRLYDAIPCVCIYSFDETIFFGIFWRKTMAIQGPSFEVTGSQTQLGRILMRHFEDNLIDTIESDSVRNPQRKTNVFTSLQVLVSMDLCSNSSSSQLEI